ncbi:MAG: phenol 2-monooxygenase [Bdellovibrionales bacterium CG10_big_fil_rev_8_21_14_0_10_45_34]|nr:MAG: phenol 2-monooxygenase [Bdellovibrionales bacterium CG10_big_fil_rev_8_21_14_0_10_45_34]
MARKIYKCKLSQLGHLTPTVRELVFDILEGEKLEFEAGQFVMMRVPGGEKPSLRAYSIASSDALSTQFKLLIKLVPGGVASEFVETYCKVGTVVEFTGPFGKLLFQEPPAKKVLFFCTGAGLSQHICMLESKAHKYPETEFYLYKGALSEKEIYYKDVLQNLKEKLPQFKKYEFTIDDGSATWQGRTGYVNQFLDEFDLASDIQIYLCGNPNMIKSMKADLERKGFSKDRLYAEAFY